MMSDTKDTTLRVDGYTRVCLTAITMLLGMLVIGLWADFSPFNSRAQASEKSAAEARAKKAGFRDHQAAKAVLTEGRWGTSSSPNKLAAEQQRTNDKLDELIRLFRSGKARVQVVEGSK